MNVAARLAYSQMKTTRSRSALTLAAIALSTALTTGVCGFAVSAEAMLKNMLGSNYGQYGASYRSLLLIPAVLLGLLIAAMSVIVISNVFRISAGERTAQFGILKCVGATEKQIRRSVLYESLFLCAVGIPSGLLLGTGLTYAGIGAAQQNLDQLNALVHMMIYRMHLSLEYVFSWQALLVSALISFLTVTVSALLPAKRAAKASAVESIRGSIPEKQGEHRVKSGGLSARLFGFEGELAVRSFRSARRNYRSTVIALASGVVLFVVLAELSGLAESIENFIMPKIDQSVICEYSSARYYVYHPETDRDESVYRAPIESAMGDSIVDRLSAYDGGDIYGTGNDLETYHTILSYNYVSQQTLEALEYPQAKDYEFSVEIITLDSRNYAALCDAAGVSVGSTVLLNHYSYNDMGHMVTLAPFQCIPTEIRLVKADDSESKIKIDAALAPENLPKELDYINTGFVRLVVPEAMVRSYAWYADPEDAQGFIDYARELMEEVFPEKEDAEYMETGFNTRVYRLEEYVKVMNIAVVLASVLMYSFAVLLMLIGVTNVISTMSAGVLLRAREFAVLESVGMTPHGLRNMLALESLLCSSKALLWGLPIGILLTWLINLPVRTMYPIPYHLPWLAVLLCIAGVTLLTIITTLLAALSLRRRNIIETVRSESGR